MSNGAIKDASIALTTGGTSQTALAANPARQFLFIENPTTESEVLLVNFGAAATSGSETAITLAAGSFLNFDGSFVPNSDVRVNAATTGHKVTIKWA